MTPLRGSHPADLAAAVRRRRRPQTLARMDEAELLRQVEALAGAPLARGGRLLLRPLLVKQALAILLRPRPLPQLCRSCRRRVMPMCGACRRPCGVMAYGLYALFSACHPNTLARCPRCWVPAPRRCRRAAAARPAGAR